MPLLGEEGAFPWSGTKPFRNWWRDGGRSYWQGGRVGSRASTWEDHMAWKIFSWCWGWCALGFISFPVSFCRANPVDAAGKNVMLSCFGSQGLRNNPSFISTTKNAAHLSGLEFRWAQMSIVFFWMQGIMYSRELLFKSRRLTTWYFTVRGGVRTHPRKQCRFLLRRQTCVSKFLYERHICYQLHGWCIVAGIYVYVYVITYRLVCAAVGAYTW